MPEPALNRPLTSERLSEQIEKTGSTPFRFENLRIELDEGLALPVSEINELRRRALEGLLKLRADRNTNRQNIEGIYGRIDRLLGDSKMFSIGSEAPEATEAPESASVRFCGNAVSGTGVGKNCSACSSDNRLPNITAVPRIALYFYRWDEGYPYFDCGADRLYFPATAIEKPDFHGILNALRTVGTEVFAWLPPVTRGNYSRVVERLLEKNTEFFDGILVGNPGTVHRIKESLRGHSESCRLAGDLSMNLFNSLSVEEAGKLGFDSIALSAELTLRQIQALSKPAEFAMEAVVYGRLPLMTSEYCPVGSTEGGFAASRKCSGCCGNGEFRLKDRMGAEFPVLCDRVDCRSTILNSNVLFLPDALIRLKSAGIGIFRLNIWDEAPSVVKELVDLYRAAAEGNQKGMAEHSLLSEEIRSAGFTKGHFFRGV